jgi:hypothetical protein
MSSKINYYELPDLENIYLEDSYLLNIRIRDGNIELIVEAVLLENHPLYSPPLPGEQYCYRNITISFPRPKVYNLVTKEPIVRSIPRNEIINDFGNIDEFYRTNNLYYLKGEWGELTIVY